MSGFAKKDDLQSFATKDDLQSLATKDDIKKLSAEIKEVKDAINESVVPYTTHVDDQVQDREKRLTKLERQAV